MSGVVTREDETERTGPILSVRGVSKRFGGVIACSDISFDVAEGETVAILGPNGAGKSTLFDCIAGYHAVDSGELFFMGRRVDRFSSDHIARLGVSRTFQNMRLFPRMTVVENVMVGALLRCAHPSVARLKSLELLERVGLSERPDVLASSLSTGQRKRLELARALATEPRLLLLDEVSGGVDATAIPGLLSLIKSLTADGLTIVMVEHNMRVVRALAGRLLALHLGRLIADGPPEVVVHNEQVIEAYLGRSYVGPE